MVLKKEKLRIQLKKKETIKMEVEKLFSPEHFLKKRESRKEYFDFGPSHSVTLVIQNCMVQNCIALDHPVCNDLLWC